MTNKRKTDKLNLIKIKTCRASKSIIKKVNRVTVSDPACKKLGGHYSVLKSKKLNKLKKSSILHISRREANCSKREAQGELLPPNWRDRQMQRITTSQSRSPGAEPREQNPPQEPCGSRKPALKLTNCWRLHEDHSESQKLQGNPVRGGGGAHIFVSCTQEIDQNLKMNIGGGGAGIPTCFWQEEGKGSILEYSSALCS